MCQLMLLFAVLMVMVAARPHSSDGRQSAAWQWLLSREAGHGLGFLPAKREPAQEPEGFFPAEPTGPYSAAGYRAYSYWEPSNIAGPWLHRHETGRGLGFLPAKKSTFMKRAPYSPPNGFFPVDSLAYYANPYRAYQPYDRSAYYPSYQQDLGNRLGFLPSKRQKEIEEQPLSKRSPFSSPIGFFPDETPHSYNYGFPTRSDFYSRFYPSACNMRVNPWGEPCCERMNCNCMDSMAHFC